MMVRERGAIPLLMALLQSFLAPDDTHTVLDDKEQVRELCLHALVSSRRCSQLAALRARHACLGPLLVLSPPRVQPIPRLPLAFLPVLRLLFRLAAAP